MQKQVEFFFDIVSPASYLAWTQMPKFSQETGAEIIYRPFFVPGLFKEVGNASPITIPAKGKWIFDDFALWAKKYDVPFVMNRKFPNNSLYAMRGLIAYQGTEFLRPLGDEFYKVMWAENGDINDPDIVQKIVSNSGIDFDEYQQAVAKAEVKQAVFDISVEAKDRGAFGAPTFFVGDKMFWGQDRLDFVRDALSAA